MARSDVHRVNLRLFSTSVMVASCVISCGGTEAAAQFRPLEVYVGQVDGTDARIALVRDDARWAAYVCGGPSTLSSMTEWFEGESKPSTDGGAEAQSNGRLLRVAF